MKKLLLLSILFSGIKIFGQAVPNGSFENWNNISYDDPDLWNTANFRDVERIGTPTISKVTGFSGFAIRIETKVNGADTSESYIINTDNPCSDPPSWTGGVPYSQQPTALTGYYRYNLPGNDTALLIVIFRKNGAHIGDNYIKIRGTGSQPTFASFSFPVTCAGVPDSLIIAAAASNKISNAGVQNGSFIELDNLGFAGASQIIPNGNFENWTAKTYYSATGWKFGGEGVTRSTSSYSGTYSIKLETLTEMCGGVNAAQISTGTYNNFGPPTGGYPYVNSTDTLCGFYKYIPAGTDNANININLTKLGSNVGGNGFQLSATSTYSYFEVPINAFSTPDTMRIDIQSSNWPYTTANIGSALYIDNLYLKSQPLGIIENNISQITCATYPNPVNETLRIRMNKNIAGKVSLAIYDLNSKMIHSEQFEGNTSSFSIPVEKLEAGMYFYELKDVGNNILRGKFIKQ